MNVTKTLKVLWRQARSDDFDAAYIILRSAARRMVQQGRHQWDDSYPQKEDVQNDISLAPPNWDAARRASPLFSVTTSLMI